MYPRWSRRSMFFDYREGAMVRLLRRRRQHELMGPQPPLAKLPGWVQVSRILKGEHSIVYKNQWVQHVYTFLTWLVSSVEGEWSEKKVREKREVRTCSNSDQSFCAHIRTQILFQFVKYQMWDMLYEWMGDAGNVIAHIDFNQHQYSYCWSNVMWVIDIGITGFVFSVRPTTNDLMSLIKEKVEMCWITRFFCHKKPFWVLMMKGTGVCTFWLHSIDVCVLFTTLSKMLDIAWLICP